MVRLNQSGSFDLNACKTSAISFVPLSKGAKAIYRASGEGRSPFEFNAESAMIRDESIVGERIADPNCMDRRTTARTGWGGVDQNRTAWIKGEIDV